MNRSVLCSFVLLAFVNYLMGCSISTEQQIAKEEVSFAEDKVTHVVLSDGEAVAFDSNGARLFLSTTISGRTEEGEEKVVLVDTVSQFRTSRVPSVPFEEIGSQKIIEVVNVHGRLIQFDRSGGTYDPATGMIKGRPIDFSSVGSSLELDARRLKVIRTVAPPAISKAEFLALQPLNAIELLTVGSKLLVTFDSLGGVLDTGRTAIIVGRTEEGAYVQYGLDEVVHVKVERTDVTGTVIASLGVAALVIALLGLIVAATKQSCPFVYSYDGSRYVFDAEPLGGAITRGMARTDYSRLEHLQPVDGTYRLLVRNEVPESQYLDQLSLLVVDHPASTDVVPDTSGRFHVVKEPISCTRAWDDQGSDLGRFFSKKDGVLWQSILPSDSSVFRSSLRHTLRFAFPRPPGAESARFIVNGGTSLWGSNMIREILTLRGEAVDEWYKSIDRRGEEMFRMFRWIEREEIYLLKLYVREGDGWAAQGHIFWGGPLVLEDRVMELDLSRVVGDTVYLEINPPVGFWAFDYVALEYGAEPPPEVHAVPLLTAEKENGTDVMPMLQFADGAYHVMPEVGNWAKVEFEVPERIDGMGQSLFLKSTGYYTLHLPRDRPEQTELLSWIFQEPGGVVRFAMGRYLEWRSSLLATLTHASAASSSR